MYNHSVWLVFNAHSWGGSVKKKFLLANKHITKCVYQLICGANSCLISGYRLNSTLSIRIEELNAQISTLYVENLRLRASEIALATQLQREREKSWRIMTDAEAAVRKVALSVIAHSSSFLFRRIICPSTSDTCASRSTFCRARPHRLNNRQHHPKPADQCQILPLRRKPPGSHAPQTSRGYTRMTKKAK